MDDKQIASTILQQLGGGHFVRMTGARDLRTLDRGLSLRINSTNYDRRRVNRVEVTLDGNDTYTVRALFVTSKRSTVVASQSDVYCDTLQATFEQVTGMLPCMPGFEVRYA